MAPSRIIPNFEYSLFFCRTGDADRSVPLLERGVLNNMGRTNESTCKRFYSYLCSRMFGELVILAVISPVIAYVPYLFSIHERPIPYQVTAAGDIILDFSLMNPLVPDTVPGKGFKTFNVIHYSPCMSMFSPPATLDHFDRIVGLHIDCNSAIRHTVHGCSLREQTNLSYPFNFMRLFDCFWVHRISHRIHQTLRGPPSSQHL